MLEIKNINKTYELKDEKVIALKDLNIKFRESEFVSILGPSGCGKTTLLNIIGGLDRYTSGDLIINGVSTKTYKDRDWDKYRNHKVGFVFQSYNLIPHQTVLENVELALTLSGVKKKERRARAVEVLTKVGLGDKLKNKPNQLSGGQMQRVAIARALVNDPEIILADEPTGALDSKTSVQIMDLLKEVSKDRLVIMVTHNPDLANDYSSRIIRLLDGELIEDTKPMTKQEEKKTKQNLIKEKDLSFKKSDKKKSMSYFTALFLSLKNLLTKKGRTIMVAFAGSIGIIGIALILAVSAGMTNYINTMQSTSLSSYPISVNCIAIDYDSVVSAVSSDDKEKLEKNENEIAIYDIQKMLIGLGRYNYMGEDFVSYVNDYYSQNSKKDMLNDLDISYSSDMRIVTNYGGNYLGINNTFSTSVMQNTTSSKFFKGLKEEYVRSLYDVYGEYPTNKNQVALVISSDSVASLELNALGIETRKDSDDNYIPIKYEDIINHKVYKLILNDTYYDASTETPYLDFSTFDSNPMAMFTNKAELENLFSKTDESEVVELDVTCILKLKNDATGSIFSTGIMYTQELENFYHNNCKNSQVVNAVKNKYLDADKKFIDGDLEFKTQYIVRIEELTTYFKAYKDSFTYTTPKSMQNALKDNFSIDLTDEETIDLYLQIYGASDVPTSVKFYLKSFDAKEDLIDMLNTYNGIEGHDKIYYTDSSAFLTNMLGSIVNIISYVLVAFAGISLLVSSIMIGIITYTSVVERTKEIGVLRSVGASKRDVKRVFTAETVIIGFLAGVIGILISLILTIPISALLKVATGIGGLAVLNFVPAICLIIISVFLTFIAGLIPARIASKKDPVLALRTE